MKVKALQFLNKSIHVGVQAAADDTTHEISLLGSGYLVVHRSSGRAYHVHGSLVVAELDLEGDDASSPAADAVSRRGQSAKKQTPLPPG